MSPGLEYNCGSLLNLHIRAPSGEPAPECPRLACMGTVNKDDVDERIALHVEVCQSPASSAASADVEQAVRRFIGTQSLRYEDGPLALERGRDSFLDAHVLSVCVCDTAAERAAPLGQKLLFWQARAELKRTKLLPVWCVWLPRASAPQHICWHVGIYVETSHPHSGMRCASNS